MSTILSCNNANDLSLIDILATKMLPFVVRYSPNQEIIGTDTLGSSRNATAKDIKIFKEIERIYDENNSLAVIGSTIEFLNRTCYVLVSEYSLKNLKSELTMFLSSKDLQGNSYNVDYLGTTNYKDVFEGEILKDLLNEVYLEILEQNKFASLTLKNY